VLPQKDCAASTLPLALPSLGTQEIFERILPAGHGLQPVLRFVFQSEGKRLRPRLFYLSARLFNNPTERLADAAVLVEALHNGTLLHDDVMDRAKVRRNRPTVNRLWGDGVAILAGDFLLASVMDLALRTEHPSVLRLALETLTQLVEGQMLELQNQGNLSLAEPTSMEIIRKKTASLFAMACRLGGLLGQGTPDQVRALESFGLHLGVAFQLLDDIQDYTSVQSHTGKEPGRDLAEANVTLPVLVAFRQAGPKEKKRIRSIFADPRRAEHLKEVTVLVGELGGFSYTFQRARASIDRAVHALQIIPACPEKAAIEQTAWGILAGNTPPGCAHPPKRRRESPRERSRSDG
jgi:octaprenyl-diphosphate synthase